MIFKLYYRKTPGRAPEYVSLKKDYDVPLPVEAKTKHEVVQLIANHDPRVEFANQKRNIECGDILVDEDHIAWIYTAFWKWAQVKTYKQF